MPGIGKSVDAVLSSIPTLLSLCKNLFEMNKLITLLEGMQFTNESWRANFQPFPQKE